MNNKPKLEREFRKPLIEETYRQAFETKIHYDRLSWTIAAPIFVFFGASLIVIQGIDSGTMISSIGARTPIAVAAIALILFWWFIYQRNRIWVEVANETIRDIERQFHSDGMGMRLLQAVADGKVVLKNLDINGDPIIKADGTPMKPYEELLIKIPMHKSIGVGLWVFVFIVLFAWFEPLATY